MKIIESLLTKNRCYQKGEKIVVKGLMLHSIGCPQPSAKALVQSWNSASAGTCVHAFIDGNSGEIYQTLPWNHRAWHCGSGNKGSGNNFYIAVEMCEPACIKYTSGANFTCSNLVEARTVAERTYKAAVELFAMLCQKYNLNPLADGVILSHREGHARGIASNHGDPEHLWTQLGLMYTMDGFRRAVKVTMNSVSSMGGYMKIMGKSAATVQQMQAYIKAKNPNVAQSVWDMIPFYLSEGEAEGIRGDIAFAQSCLETGNFTFSGSAVTLDQNNFCGMGVTQNGMKGNSFASPQFGIRAQIQHLKAYASMDVLKNACIDLRFQYVARGCAPYVEWLGQKENPAGKGWATGAGYGEKILNILNAVLAIPAEDTKEKTGWIQENEGWRYYLDSRHCVCNDWYQDDGKWYYFDTAGMMIESAWQQYKDGWYYLGIDGAMLTGLQTLDGKWYYFDQDGRMTTEPVLLIPDADGVLHYPEKA